MKKILIVLALLGLLQADDESARVVYDLTTSNITKFEKNILKGIAINKAHYQGSFKELEAVVVIHGGAYRFFVKDIEKSMFNTDLKLVEAYSDLKKRIAIMADTYEVEFLMCRASMPKNGLEDEDVVEFVKIVPNSTVGLIDKQNEGFAYIPVRD
ncbi:MAG: DsrE family protein [Sulfurimonas sp.]|nr:DsrE family protein [Sulfurimonas sp.]